MCLHVASGNFAINFHCYCVAYCIKKKRFVGHLMCGFCLLNDPSVSSWTNNRHWVQMWVSKMKPLEDMNMFQIIVKDNYWLDRKEWVGKYRILHFLEWLNIKLTHIPITPLTGIHGQRWQHTLPKHYMPIFIAAIFVIMDHMKNIHKYDAFTQWTLIALMRSSALMTAVVT